MPTRGKRPYLEKLQELLAQSPRALRAMESKRYDRLAGDLGTSLVLFGAGGLGRKTLSGLRKLGIEPAAFADTNPRLHAGVIDGLKVLSPAQAAIRYGKSSLFIITIYVDSAPGCIEPIQQRLQELGCKKAISFAYLYWKYPEIFLPHYAYDLPHKVVEAGDEIMATAHLFKDAISQQEYVGQIHWRLDPGSAPVAPRASHAIYFPPELFGLGENEVFVDCGAYDGDTVRSFLEHTQGIFTKLYAFEPDPGNFQKLSGFVGSLPDELRDRIHCSDLAIGAQKGEIHFNASGAASSTQNASGELTVRCETLDSLLEDEIATFIKMDIEGAEVEALKGAALSISKHLPILAISAYHRQSDIWRIPHMLAALSGNYRFFLRRYTQRVLDDLVLYAIPAPRLLSGSTESDR